MKRRAPRIRRRVADIRYPFGSYSSLNILTDAVVSCQGEGRRRRLGDGLFAALSMIEERWCAAWCHRERSEACSAICYVLREFTLAVTSLCEGITHMPRESLTAEQVLTMLSAGPPRIAALTANLPPALLQTRPAPDEWSANEV